MFKRIINKLKRIIQNILFEYANKREFYNPFLSIWFAICPMIGKMGNSRHKAVLKSLLADMHSIVEKYKNRDVLDGRISDECPIWILWWQGWKFTPPLCNYVYSQYGVMQENILSCCSQRRIFVNM